MLTEEGKCWKRGQNQEFLFGHVEGEATINYPSEMLNRYLYKSLEFRAESLDDVSLEVKSIRMVF
jgi:hypothetical protein